MTTSFTCPRPPSFQESQTSNRSSSSNSNHECNSDDEDDDEAARRRASNRERGAAIEIITVPGGTIRLYVDEGNKTLYAKASCDSHSDCHKQRTMLGPPSGRGPKGRPIGYLVAWLRKGLEASVMAGASHHHKFGVAIDRGERRAGRAVAKEAEGGQDMLSYERMPWPDDSESEPREQP